LLGTVTNIESGASPFVRVTRRPTRREKSGKIDLTPNQKNISAAFVDARQAALGLSAYPGKLPATLAEGYAVQDVSIARWPDVVGGWKIGLVPPAFRGSVGAERLVGPIFSDLIRGHVDGEVHTMPVFADGFAAIEAEFIFVLAEAVPVGTEITPELARRVAGKLHVGVEIASSPFPGINELGPICVVTDFGNNFGLIVGPEVTDWQSRSWSDMPASVTINGTRVGATTAASLPGGPIGALEFTLRLMQTRGIALEAGSHISTGAVTGVHEAHAADNSRVDFGPWGEIDLTLTALEPGWGRARLSAG
jgi:2-keto-4-pentenoate hydratase